FCCSQSMKEDPTTEPLLSEAKDEADSVPPVADDTKPDDKESEEKATTLPPVPPRQQPPASQPSQGSGGFTSKVKNFWGTVSKGFKSVADDITEFFEEETKPAPLVV